MTLVLAVHGTASPAGQAVYRDVADAVGRRAPCRLAHLDVVAPLVADVVAPGDVVVPVLLARGFHVRVDCADAAARGAVVADAVGPHPALVRLADRRLREAGADDDAPVVLAAAGSRDPRAVRDLRRARSLLSSLREGPVELAYASRPGDVAAAVGRLRAAHGRRVAAATWLLAPGRFADAVGAAGADVVTAPLGADAAVVDVVLARYRAAARAVAA